MAGQSSGGYGWMRCLSSLLDPDRGRLDLLRAQVAATARGPAAAVQQRGGAAAARRSPGGAGSCRATATARYAACTRRRSRRRGRSRTRDRRAVGSRCPILRSALLTTASKTAMSGARPGRRRGTERAGRPAGRGRSTAAPCPARTGRRGDRRRHDVPAHARTRRRRRPRGRPACRRGSPTAAVRRRSACRRSSASDVTGADRAVQVALVASTSRPSMVPWLSRSRAAWSASGVRAPEPPFPPHRPPRRRCRAPPVPRLGPVRRCYRCSAGWTAPRRGREPQA